MVVIIIINKVIMYINIRLQSSMYIKDKITIEEKIFKILGKYVDI